MIQKLKKIVSYILLAALIAGIFPNTVFAQSSYETDRINPDGYAGNEVLQKNFNTTQELSGINWKVLNINGFDANKLGDWEKIGKVLIDAKKDYDPENPGDNLYAQYVDNGNQINKNIADAAGVNQLTMSNFDIRTLESLAFLAGNKYSGGAGREFLNIASITRGYNTLNDNSSRGKTAKEADSWSIEVDEDALKHISPHNSQWGSAVAVTDIDYVRGTVLVYDQDDKLVKKQKMPNKIPVKVEWQTDYRPGGNSAFSLSQPRNLLSGSMLSSLFKGNANQAFNTFTSSLLSNSDLGFELPQTLPINADNLSQMVTQNVGMSTYLNEVGLPNFKPGHDLSSNGYNLGTKMTEILSGGNLPAEGLKGDSLLALETNIGREWTAQQLGLPAGSLYGDNSKDMIANLGRAAIADKLNIEKDALKYLDNGNTALRIGQGYINKNLNLAYDTFSDKNKTLNDIKTHIGNEKADYIFSNPAFVDTYLGLPKGATNSFVSGSTSPDDYAKAVGETRINEFTSVFGNDDYQKKYWDSLFGVSGGTIALDTFGSDATKQKDYIKANYNISNELVGDCVGTTGTIAPQISASVYFENCYVKEFANNQPKLYSWLSRYAQLKDTISTQDNKNQNLMQRFFEGDKDVFYETGVRTLSRSLSTNEDMWPYLETWIRSNNDKKTLAEVQAPNLVNNDQVKAVYADIYNNKYDFSIGDIERIFMLNRADYVFNRVGVEKLDDAFNQSGQTDEAVFSQKPTTYDNYYNGDFYTDKFTQLANNDILNSLKSINTNASQMIITAVEGASYKELSADDYKFKRRVDEYNRYIDKIDYLFSILEKDPSVNQDLSSVRFQIYDLMAGKNIPDPRSYSKDQIKESFSEYNLITGTFQDIYEVVQENTTIGEYAQTIGLMQLSDSMLEHPETNILIDANKSIVQSNYQNSLTRLNEIAGNEFVNTEQKIVNSMFLFEEGQTEKVTDQDVLALINGAPLKFYSKIGSHLADSAYQTNSFYSYAKGETSGADLASQSPYSQNQDDNKALNSVFKLFPASESIYKIGGEVASENYGLDILGYYTNSTFNAVENVGNFVKSVFDTKSYEGIINPANIQDASLEYIRALGAGNIKNLTDRIEANVRLNNYKGILDNYKTNFPDIGNYININSQDFILNVNDFMPTDEMQTLLGYIQNPDNIPLLKEFGRLNQEIANFSFDRAFKTVQLSILSEMKDVWGKDTDPTAILDLYHTLYNPNTSPEQIKSKFAEFLIGNTSLFNDVPEEYRQTLQTFISGGNLDSNSVADLIANVWLKDESQETKDLISSSMKLFTSIGDNNINFTDIKNAFTLINPDMSQDQLKELAGTFSAFQNFQNNKISEAFGDLVTGGLIKDTDGTFGDLINTMEALENFKEGNIEGIAAALGKNNLFGSASNELEGIMGAYLAFEGGDTSKIFSELEKVGINIEDSGTITAVYDSFTNFSNGDIAGGLTVLNEKKLFGDLGSEFSQAVSAAEAYNAFRNGNYITAANKLAEGNIFPEGFDTNKLTGAIDAAEKIKNNDISGAIGVVESSKLFGDDVKGLGITSDLLSIAGNIQSNNIAGAIEGIQTSELFGKMTVEQKKNLTENLGLVGGMIQGDYKTVFKFIGDKSGMFNDMTKVQQNAILGAVGMAMNGNISMKNMALLASNYFGFTGVSLGAFGVVSPIALINGLTNPQSLVANILSNYLSSALAGALGIGTFGASIIVGLLMGSLFGGSQRIEYQYTACGFYPTYDAAQTIEGETYENELGAVNDAKSKAVSTNSPDDWGDFIYKRVKYDTIPTDEIDEDDKQTQDEKYTSEALANEDAQKVEEYGLQTAVDWAKSKDNTMIKCMDPNGGGGVFVNESPELTKDQKKLVAKYKVNVFLGNLVHMRDRTKKYNVLEELETLAFDQKPQYNYQNFLVDTFKVQTAYAQDEIEDVKIEDIDPDYDPVGAEQSNDYKRLIDYNESQLDLRPTQIMTYGGDEAEANQSLGSNVGTTLDTGGFLAQNPIIKTLKSAIAFISSANIDKAKALFENTTTDSLDSNDVAHFYVIRDRLWGDSYGSPGSQDWILSEGLTREGFGLNQKMYDRINYSY